MADDVAVGEDFPGLPRNQLHDAVFHLREADGLPADRDAAPGKINFEFSNAVNIVRRGGRCVAAEDGAHPSQQLRRGKRLCDVIIRAVVERENFIFFRAARTDDDHGHFGPCAQFFQKLYAVNIRQPQIKQHHIRHISGDCGTRIGAVLRGKDAVSARIQHGFQNF